MLATQPPTRKVMVLARRDYFSREVVVEKDATGISLGPLVRAIYVSMTGASGHKSSEELMRSGMKVIVSPRVGGVEPAALRMQRGIPSSYRTLLFRRRGCRGRRSRLEKNYLQLISQLESIELQSREIIRSFYGCIYCGQGLFRAYQFMSIPSVVFI